MKMFFHMDFAMSFVPKRALDLGLSIFCVFEETATTKVDYKERYARLCDASALAIEYVEKNCSNSQHKTIIAV